MEESETAPVLLQPAVQIVPAADFVHRFMLDQLLKQCGGRIPINAYQAQKAGIEPRREQVAKIGVHLRKLSVLAQRVEQPLSHAYDDLRAAWRAVAALSLLHI